MPTAPTPPRPPLAPLAVLVAVALAVAGCSETTPPPPTILADSTAVGSLDVAVLEPDTVDVRGVARARARIRSVADGSAEGVVTMTRVEGGTRIQAQLEGLSSSEYHAFQVLRGRKCVSDPDVHLGVDAGTPHGGPYAPPGQRHLGDLGSIRGDQRIGRYDRIDPEMNLSGTMSPVGRAVVIRALRDDASSPGGAAGAVIGCGILEQG